MEEQDPPKYLLIESLKTDFANAIKRCEKILSQIGKVYPVEDDEDATVEIEQLSELFSKMRDIPLDQLPLRLVKEVGKETREVFRDLTELEGDVYSKQADPQRISNLLASLANRLDNLLGSLQRWLPFLILREMPTLEASAVERRLKNLKDEQDASIERLTKTVGAAVERANAAATNIEEKDKIAAAALGDIGVSEHAEKFATVQEEHATAAKYWFWGLGGIDLIYCGGCVSALLVDRD